MDDITDTSSSSKDKEPPSRSWIEKIAQNIYTPNSHEELLEIIETASKNEILDKESKEMISGALNLSTMHVRDIMLPRSQMVTLMADTPINEMMSEIIASSHTRIPMFNHARDDVIGILHTKDMLKLLYENESDDTLNIQEVLRPAVFVPESKRLDTLLKEFKSSHNHLAIVVDEYGSIAGLITIEDILEEIVGNIEDEFDEEAEHIKKISENEHHIEAITELDEFNDYFGAHFDSVEIDTVGGLIIQSIEHLPEIGETITIDKFIFTVLKADKRRINTLSVRVDE
ncbi:CBS domain-containing protein [Francisellaceae bacterium]|nr:CBS domain-containing protein [Francisellaceae bacterium]